MVTIINGVVSSKNDIDEFYKDYNEKITDRIAKGLNPLMEVKSRLIDDKFLFIETIGG